MNYEITTEDIDAYLATKQDEDTIGYTHDTRKCLIAEAIRQKYHLNRPMAFVSVGLRNAYIHTSDMHVHIALPEEVQVSLDRFDHMGWEGPITKSEWLEAQVKA